MNLEKAGMVAGLLTLAVGGAFTGGLLLHLADNRAPEEPTPVVAPLVTAPEPSVDPAQVEIVLVATSPEPTPVVEEAVVEEAVVEEEVAPSDASGAAGSSSPRPATTGQSASNPTAPAVTGWDEAEDDDDEPGDEHDDDDN